jgi:hypothetical protein
MNRIIVNDNNMLGCKPFRVYRALPHSILLIALKGGHKLYPNFRESTAMQGIRWLTQDISAK